MAEMFQQEKGSQDSCKEHCSVRDNQVLVSSKYFQSNNKFEDKIISNNIVVLNSLKKFIDEPNLKVFCHDCRKEINNVASILSGSNYRCVGCFAKLQPSQQSFQVLNSLNFSIVDLNWKAKHQILFLNFLQKFGFGNWKQIYDQMSFYGAQHSQQELQNHYNNFYVHSKDYLPKILNNELPFQNQDISISRTIASTQMFLPLVAVSNRQESHFFEIDEFYANRYTSSNEPNFIECYNDKRNQFEIQYDQNAEMLLANLQFREDDGEEETKIKFKLIEQYNRRLDRRNKVKQFILEHRLLEENYQKQMDKNRNQYQRQAFEELKPIARMMTLQEYNELVRKVAFTKQLKSTIEGLRMFRRAHPSNFKSLDQFLNSQPEQSKPKKRKNNSSSIKTGKKVEQILEKQFKLTKQDFEVLVQNLQSNNKKSSYKNVDIVMLQRGY